MTRLQLLFIICTTLLFTSCGENDTPAAATEALIDVGEMRSYNDSLVAVIRPLIKSGDLILRNGRDFSSEQVREMSKEDKSYSHGGIAIVENGEILIYHVEPDFYYKNDKVRKEPLDSFISINHNKGFALARYDLKEEEVKGLLQYMETQYQNKVSFDIGFDLRSNDKMYCSEMIMKGLRESTQNRIQIEIQRLTDKSKFKIIKQYFRLQEKDIKNREIIPIDRLYLHPSCKLLQRYSYSQ